MLSDLKLVVRLQDLDNRLTELTKEVATLPKHIAEIEKRLGTHERKLEADRAAVSGNQKNRKRLEGEIQIQEEKISKLKAQMNEARTNEQYRAFQNEIEYCNKEIHRSEDRILDLMAESEPLEKNVKLAELALKEEKIQVEKEKQQARERTAVDKRLLDELSAERKHIVSEISPQVYAAYERIRKTRGGIAAAEALDGRCTACHMAMRLQFFQDLKRSQQVMFCESCNRILYYNPPVAMEDLAHEAAPAIRD